MSDDKADTSAEKPAHEPGPKIEPIGPQAPRVERSAGPTGAVPKLAQGKRWVTTSGDTHLNVGNLHVGPEGLEVGPKQLDDIRDAAAAHGVHINVHGEG